MITSNINKNNYLRVTPFILFIVFLFMGLSRGSSFNYVGVIGSVLLLVLILLESVQNIRINSIILFFIFINIYNLILNMIFDNSTQFYRSFIQFISFSFIAIFSLISIDKKFIIKLIRYFSCFYMFFIFVFSIAILTGKTDMKSSDSFMISFMQPLFTITYFSILKFKKNIWIVFSTFVILFFSGDRGLAISILLVFLLNFLLNLIKNNKLMYKFLFFMVILGVLSYQFFYVYLYETDLGNILNTISRKYTDQNLFSGRQVIWEIANKCILESPILGYGLGNDILASNGIYMSAHNTYVDILLSGGIIQMSLFIGFMYSIWMYMFIYLDNNVVRLSASFLISILIFSVNGVILVGNDINFSIFIWFIIGIGIMTCNGINRGVYDGSNSI